MTKRIQTILDYIVPGRGVVDVGTDHGYVPVALALSGYPGNIIASDVNAEPLAAAKRYADARKISERIDFRLADGLQGCSRDQADTVIIAGMGGDLICSILAASEMVRHSDVSLILQPMTKAEILRFFLVNNGWMISSEAAVKENGKLFHILQVNYQGLLFHTSDYRDPQLEDWELYTGKTELARASGFYAETRQQSRALLKKRSVGRDGAFFRQILDGLETTEI